MQFKTSQRSLDSPPQRDHQTAWQPHPFPASTLATWAAVFTYGHGTSTWTPPAGCPPFSPPHPPPQSTRLCDTCCWVPSATMPVPSSQPACLSRLGSSFNSWEAFPALSFGICMIVPSLWGTSPHEMKSETPQCLTWSTDASQGPVSVSILVA